MRTAGHAHSALAYLGWRRFPSSLGEFEVRQFFSFTRRDREALRKRFRTRARLGAAIQLGFVRMTGTTLDAFDNVPRGVFSFTAQQLQVPAPELGTLRAMYRRRSTLYEHQSWACAYAGLRRPDASDLNAVVEGLIATCAATLDRGRLARAARETLIARGCLIASERDIRDWVRRAIALVEISDRRALDAVVNQRVRDGWLPGLLREVNPSPTTMLEWLRRPPRRRSTKTLNEELAKLHALSSLLLPPEYIAIPQERLRAYARRMRRRRPAKVQGISEPRRTLEIAALLAVLSHRQSDTVLRLIEMRISEIWTWAYAIERSEPCSVLPEQLARVLASSVNDSGISDEEFRAQARALLSPWPRAADVHRTTRAAQVRERLAKDRRRIRPLLKNVIALHLQTDPGHPVAAALRELECCYRESCLHLLDSATAPMGHAWNPLLQDADRQKAFRAYEAATLWALRCGLRNGSIWAEHAHHYGGKHRMLLPERRWNESRDSFLERRELPRTADEFIARTLDQVQSGLLAVKEAAAAGELEIHSSGRLVLRDDPRITVEPGDADQVRSRLYDRLSRVQLPALLLEVDSQTHFSWELLGRAPSAPEELVPLYAAILVSAMALESTDVAMTILGVRLSAIRRASVLLEKDHALRRANDVVVTYLLAQPLAKQWGDGYEASSDMMSLDVSRHVWMARVDPKRRRHAVGTYTHVLNQWGIVYDQPLLLSTRQAGAAIEGAVRQSMTRLERIAVDTHGYTDLGMAVAKLLGFDLCPRLYSMRDRHLHVPRRFDIPASIAGIVEQDVSLEPIREHWEDLLRLVATIDEGWRSATDVLERFGSDARGHKIYRAGHALGQLLRTIYLCDYFTLPEFRRSVYQILDRGESVHALQRQICSQALPTRRGRTNEDLIATSGSLSLITNCVMAWNTERLQRAVDREVERTPSAHSIKALRGIGPVGHRHINFRGTYRFPIERYAERLCASAA